MSKKSQKLFASLTATSLVAAGAVVPVAAEEAPKYTVEVTNNVTVVDQIVVKGVPAKETVKVYAKNSTADTALFTKKQGSSAGDVTIKFSKTVKLPELAEGATEGSIYITVTKDGVEGALQEVKYAAEAPTTTANVVATAVNNVTKKDQIVLKTSKNSSPDAATAGAEVKVYADAALKTELAKGKIAAFKNGATESTTTLNLKGKFTSADTVYVVVTNKNYLASKAIEVTVDPEAVTAQPKEYKLNNHVTKKDSLTVKGLDTSKKTVVNVYKVDPTDLDATAKKAALIGTGKPKADVKGSTPGTAEVVIKGKDGYKGLSHVWLTLKNDNENESKALKVDVTSEDTTAFKIIDTTADTSTVTSTEDVIKINVNAVNNVTKKDQIKIIGAPVNSQIFIYTSATADTADAKAAVAKAKVKKPKTGDRTETVINMPKKGFASDTEELKYYIAIKADNELISEVKEFKVAPAQATDLEGVEFVTENNVTLKDKVIISGAQAKAKVNIYKVNPETLKGADKKTVSAAIIGKGTIKAIKNSTSTDTAITISKGLPEDVIYVEITNPNELPTVTTVDVSKEEYSTLSTGATVTVINNAKAKEQVKLTNLTEKDIVKVFVLKDGKLDEKAGGKATVKKDGTATVSLKSKFTDDKLETIYVTVQNKNKRPVYLKVADTVKSGTAVAVEASETTADTAIVAPATEKSATPDSITVTPTTAKNVAVITVKTKTAGETVVLYDGTTKVKSAKSNSSKEAKITLTGVAADKTYKLGVTGKELLESDLVDVQVKKYVASTSGDTASISFTSTFAAVDFGAKLVKGSVAVKAALPNVVAVNRSAAAPVATTVFA